MRPWTPDQQRTAKGAAQRPGNAAERSPADFKKSSPFVGLPPCYSSYEQIIETR
jgi:hypothetical protein